MSTSWYSGKVRSPQLPGMCFTLGGQGFNVALLPNALRRLATHVSKGQEAVASGDTVRQVDYLVECGVLVLSANYPGMSKRLLGDNATIPELVNMIAKVLTTVWGASALPATTEPAPESSFSHFVVKRNGELGN